MALASGQNSRIKEFNFHIVMSFTLSDSIEKKQNKIMSKTKQEIAYTRRLCL
jgi:hypothetical protein